MSRSRPQRIVIAGAGIAGALLVAMLRRSAAREILCFEQTEAGAQEGIGTGLNIGPNAVKTLRAFAPALAAALEAHALPWREWRIALTDGRELARIDLRDVADNPGLRLRWSELYRLLRAPIAEQVRFGEAVVGFRYAADGEEGPLVVTVENRLDGARRFIGGVDLLIGADGRFSQVRGAFEAPSPPRHLGIANFRLLIPHGPDGLIDDYVQYYNGPNRLLAFRVPGDAIYLSATLPVQPGARLAADRRTPVALQTPYRPSSGALAPACAFLLEAVERLHADIHWSRFSERDICFTDRRGRVLLLGDAAHPIVPTLGQGATQTVEDACVAQAAINDAAEPHAAIATIRERRLARIAHVAALSWKASAAMLSGADPVAAARDLSGADFLATLAQLYRDTPMPAAV
jgi:salicylate hydroxylase